MESKANSIKKSARRRKNNNSMINIDTLLMKKDMIKLKKSNDNYDKISFLSNANLNIIKILNNAANNESFINNKSSFLEDLKEKSILSITKRKRNKSGQKKSNGKKVKRREKTRSNKNINKYDLIRSINNDLEVGNNGKFKYSTTIGLESLNSSTFSNKKTCEKDLLSGRNNIINLNKKSKKISCNNLSSKMTSKRTNLKSPIKLKNIKNSRPRSRSILFPRNTLDINNSSTTSKDRVFHIPRKKIQSNNNIMGIMNDINFQRVKERIEPEVNLVHLNLI